MPVIWTSPGNSSTADRARAALTSDLNLAPGLAAGPRGSG